MAKVKSAISVYLTVSGFLVPFMEVYSATVTAFRTMSNSKSPMYIMLNMNILNLILTAFAIYSFKFGILELAA